MSAAPTAALKSSATSNNERDKPDWPRDIWECIDQDLYNENQQTQLTAEFIPTHGSLPPGTPRSSPDSPALRFQFRSLQSLMRAPSFPVKLGALRCRVICDDPNCITPAP